MGRLPSIVLPPILLILLLFVLNGCSAKQEIVLSPDGAGTGTIEIQLDPVFAAYLSDVSAGLGAADDAPLFDIEAIEGAFAHRRGLDLLSIDIPDPSRLVMEVSFSSVEEVLALEGRSLTRFLRFERTETFRRVAAEIDRHAIEQFTSLSGIDPFVVESLLPPDPDMSRQEYQDHLAWALEEYAEDRPLGTVFEESRIVTELSPQGEIITVSNGRRIGDTIEFSTALVDAVVAREPIRYSIVFAP